MSSFRLLLSKLSMERLLPCRLHFQLLCFCHHTRSQASGQCTATPGLRSSATTFACRMPRIGVTVRSRATSSADMVALGVTSPFVKASDSAIRWRVRRPAPFKAGKHVGVSMGTAAAADTRRYTSAVSRLFLKGHSVPSLSGDVFFSAGEPLNPYFKMDSRRTAMSAFILEVPLWIGQPLLLLPPCDALFRSNDATNNLDFNATVAAKNRFERLPESSYFKLPCNSLVRAPGLPLPARGAAQRCAASYSLSATSPAETCGLLRHGAKQRRHERQKCQSERMSWRKQQQEKHETCRCRRPSQRIRVRKSISSTESLDVWTPEDSNTPNRMLSAPCFRESAASHLCTSSHLWHPAGGLSRCWFSTSGGNGSGSAACPCKADAEASKDPALLGKTTPSGASQQHSQYLSKDTEKVDRQHIGRSGTSSIAHHGSNSLASGTASSCHTPASEVAASTSAASSVKSNSLPSKSSSGARADAVALPEGHSLLHVEKRTVGEALEDGTSLDAVQPYAGDKTGFLKERYGPPRDPSTLLIEPHRLTKEERFFQNLFVALPGVAFLMMLATPVALVRYHVRKLQERMACTEQIAEELAGDLWGPSFQDCDFLALRNVIEQPTHAFVFYFHPESLSSQVVRPLLRDIANVFRKLRVRVMVAAVDLADKSVPDTVRRMFPVALAPHGELLLPYAFQGQQPALQLYDGEWEAQSIVKTVAQEIPAAAAALDAAKELNEWTESLSDCLFALRFVDDRPGDGTAIQQQQGDGSSSNAQGSSNLAAAVAAERFIEERARAIGLAEGGLREALRECASARQQLRIMVQQLRSEGSLPT